MKPALPCVLTINAGPMGGFGEGIGIWSLKDHINGELGYSFSHAFGLRSTIPISSSPA
jgi:hypothetical protein